MIVVLKDLIELLRMKHEIEVRDKDGCRLFNCSSNSQALEPYFNREVIEWFAFVGEERKVCITIGEEDDEDKEIASKFLEDVKKHFNKNAYHHPHPWELTIKLYIKDKYYTIMLNPLIDRYTVSTDTSSNEFYSYKSIKEWLNEMCNDEILPDLDYCKYLTKDIN